jgi:hypothetical protein
MAGQGESGTVAALVSLLMGMRASEITTRVARDLDDGGRLLWIPDAKTEAGKRTPTGTGGVAAVPERARGGKTPAGEALRRSLAGLGEEVGEADLP